jgi:hypothetical protein
MKSITFADAYGLGLIAKNPQGKDWSEIRQNLSDEAQRIAEAIIMPGSAPEDDAKSAAQEWVDLANGSSVGSQSHAQNRASR